MASSSFYSGTGVTPDNTDVDPVVPSNITAIEDSTNAAAASAAAAASSQTSASNSATGAANSAASASSSATAAAASATSSASSAATASSAQTAAEAAELDAQTAQAAAEAAQTAAETAQVAAETAETNAETAETNAETAQTAAEAAQAAAEAAKDAIDGLYLGAQASDPTVDGLGAALTPGDWYYSTTYSVVRIYNGSTWVNGSTDGSLFATAAQGTLADSAVQPNDSPLFGSITVSGTVDGRDVATDGTKLDGIEAGADVTDTANVTAAGALMDSEVTNLAQVKEFDSSDYATAAQGALAASATQPGDLATVATSGAYGDLSGTPTLGTAAATASTDYATAAQGANANTAYGWGDHTAAGYTTAASAESNALALAIALG
jgi:chemotaxis protein histidine kinase CheA